MQPSLWYLCTQEKLHIDWNAERAQRPKEVLSFEKLVTAPATEPDPLPQTVKLLLVVMAVLSFEFFVLARCQMSYTVKSSWDLKLLLHRCSIFYPEELCRLEVPTSLFLEKWISSAPRNVNEKQVCLWENKSINSKYLEIFLFQLKKIHENKKHENQTTLGIWYLPTA